MVYLNKQLCTTPSFAVDFLMMLNFCSKQLIISIARPQVAGSVVSSKQKARSIYVGADGICVYYRFYGFKLSYQTEIAIY